MQKLLTIVVPSYNVEDTLEQTIKSMLISNTNLRSLLEILIVNDGSTDNTKEIADQFANEYPEIIHVYNKENGGHGSAINVGIERAQGKYLKIVDGDDWLDTEGLELFLTKLIDTDADIIATDYYRYFMSSKKMASVKASNLVYNKHERFVDIWTQYTFPMHSTTVKVCNIREQKNSIDEHCYYVDTEYDVLAALSAETVLYLDIKLYVYRLQREGQSVSVQGFIKHYMEHFRVCCSLISWYQNIDNKSEIERQSFLEKKVIKTLMAHYLLAFDFPKKEMQEFLKHLKECDKKIRDELPNVYIATNKNKKIKLIRYFNFSRFVYSGVGIFDRTKKAFFKPAN